MGGSFQEKIEEVAELLEKRGHVGAIFGSTQKLGDLRIVPVGELTVEFDLNPPAASDPVSDEEGGDAVAAEAPSEPELTCGRIHMRPLGFLQKAKEGEAVFTAIDLPGGALSETVLGSLRAAIESALGRGAGPPREEGGARPGPGDAGGRREERGERREERREERGEREGGREERGGGRHERGRCHGEGEGRRRGAHDGAEREHGRCRCHEGGRGRRHGHHGQGQSRCRCKGQGHGHGHGHDEHRCACRCHCRHHGGGAVDAILDVLGRVLRR